ncbi:ankyrin [Anaeromyces robustus]|uniref:Ankyrin n=1 Tax=Anaeromyces robustus TaxID=1754192 RepID=A0A1Y1XM41_9FUNG|nr:ankyrin [Anaeromyces robustus]|eukprot:ORX86819.1 ankyrin [Anaeromyces robustus]
MTNSDFETFKKELFKKLRKESKKCSKIIEQNKKLIENYLYNKELPQVKEFVNEFNNIVLDKKIKKYQIFETVLKDKLFDSVLAQFRESDVLVRACKQEYENSVGWNIIKLEHKKVIDWLLTMNINYGAKDELGMTALMYAVRHSNLEFVVEKIMSTNGKHINLVNNKGNNALFFASLNEKNLKRFIKYKDSFDPNHLNNNNENIILFICRFGDIISEEHVLLMNQLNCSYPNITNDDGLTAAMYLVKRGKFQQIKSIVEHYNIDPNYKNKFNNTLVSVYIQEYYTQFQKCIGETEGFGLNIRTIKRLAHILRNLVDIGCDFHIPVDEDGNSVTTILSKMKDEITIQYLLEKNCVDYAVDNKLDQNNNKYNEIDITNPVIKTNFESVNKWLKEVYYPSGTLNTEIAGILLHGHNHPMY